MLDDLHFIKQLGSFLFMHDCMLVQCVGGVGGNQCVLFGWQSYLVILMAMRLCAYEKHIIKNQSHKGYDLFLCFN